jgi:hypothetical protein
VTGDRYGLSTSDLDRIWDFFAQALATAVVAGQSDFDHLGSVMTIMA